MDEIEKKFKRERYLLKRKLRHRKYRSKERIYNKIHNPIYYKKNQKKILSQKKEHYKKNLKKIKLNLIKRKNKVKDIKHRWYIKNRKRVLNKVSEYQIKNKRTKYYNDYNRLIRIKDNEKRRRQYKENQEMLRKLSKIKFILIKNNEILEIPGTKLPDKLLEGYKVKSLNWDDLILHYGSEIQSKELLEQKMRENGMENK